MRLLSAPWVLPIDRPPIRDGWVAVDGARVRAVGGREDAPPPGVERLHVGSAALMPGLVNAHTHLELSYLRGAVGAAARFTDWIRELMHLRRTREGTSPEALAAIDEAIGEALAAGTAVVGDISNTLAPVTPLNRSRLQAHVFFELVRFRSDELEQAWSTALERLAQLPPATSVRISMAPHAPYSVSPALFRRIRQYVDARPACRTSVHLCESPDECELVERGTGRWRGLLAELNAWDPSWESPRCSPVEYLDSLGFIKDDTLVVHGVHARDADLACMRRRGATLVTCPRSNRHVGVGDPPIGRFYASGMNVAIGTDSLTSAPDLNVFGELAAMRRLAPEIPAARLLESATRTGARALGFDDHGTLAPGSRAAIIAVAVPDDVRDVEAYLVAGIEPEQIHWPLEPGENAVRL